MLICIHTYFIFIEKLGRRGCNGQLCMYVCTYFNIMESLLLVFKISSTHAYSYLTIHMMLLSSFPFNYTYKRIAYKMSMIRIRTLKYSLEDRVFAYFSKLMKLNE